MPATESILPIVVILFFSTLTRSALGFGDALLAMPLLALVTGMQTVTPLVALVAQTISAAILLGSWRQANLRAARRLVLSSCVGIPFGLWLLKTAPESLVKGILGGLLILFGLYNLSTPRLPAIRNEKLAHLFGFVAGVLGGAYNTNGPPVVVYGALRRWPPERFRATMQGYFFPVGWLLVAGHGLGGLWTPAVIRLYGLALPAVLLAIFLGGRLNRIIPADRFARVIYAVLVGMGILMLL